MTAAADCKPASSLLQELNEFRVHSYAMLVDEEEPAPCVAELRDLECRGVYTFTLDAAGRRVLGHKVGLLPAEAPSPCDAWVVATGSKAVYALNQYLAESGRDRELVINAVQRRFTSMFSYVDFFKGETNTVLYLHNVFERTYKIHFPIAVRWLLRDRDGTVIRTSQLLVRPSQTVALDSRALDLPDGFVGCLELYTDVRELNAPVMPFLHMNCDYVSADDITTLHQSGLRPWAPGTAFIRGLIPADAESRLTVSLFNKPNPAPVRCTATLRYTLNGKRCETTRALPPIPRNQLTFIDINETFSDILGQGASAADLVLVTNEALHRPNYYLHRKDRRTSWYGLEHGAGAGDTALPDSRVRRFAELGLHPWICSFPVPDAASGVDVDLVYFHEGGHGLHDFVADIHDASGQLVHTSRLSLDFGTTLNLRAWCRDQGIALDQGLINLIPAPEVGTIPNTFSFMASFYHRQHPKLSPVVVGGAPWNVPYEVDRSELWNHPTVPTVHSEQFGKALVSEEFDTVIVLYNPSAEQDYRRHATVEIDLYTWDARIARVRRTVAPNGTVTLRMSELLAETGLYSEKPHYTIWIYSRNCFVTGFHMLHRKSDDALGVEHFYYGRFNALERN